jgi:hypothetical protein
MVLNRLYRIRRLLRLARRGSWPSGRQACRPRLTLLDGIPLHGGGADASDAAHGQGDLEGVRECGVVDAEDLGQERGGQELAEVGGADVDHRGGVEVGDVRETLGQLVVEDVVGDADHEGAAEDWEKNISEAPMGTSLRDRTVGTPTLACCMPSPRPTP